MFDLMLSHRPLNGEDKTDPSILTVSANVFPSAVNINPRICIIWSVIMGGEPQGRARTVTAVFLLLFLQVCSEKR